MKRALDAGFAILVLAVITAGLVALTDLSVLVAAVLAIVIAVGLLFVTFLAVLKRRPPMM